MPSAPAFAEQLEHVERALDAADAVAALGIDVERAGA